MDSFPVLFGGTAKSINEEKEHVDNSFTFYNLTLVADVRKFGISKIINLTVSL